jgi:hypothetical protein
MKIPSFASRSHPGGVYADSDAQSSEYGPLKTAVSAISVKFI